MDAYTPWQAYIIVITCGIIVIGTIIGNALVCTAVAIVRKLRTPSNLLIVSLAVSDLLVAILVMPFATTYEVMGRWAAGQTICDMWTSLDVMLCTASILNLCMISVDRYFVITRPFQYAMKRTPARMTIMIVGVWLMSALISIPPLFNRTISEMADDCVVSQEIGYQFYATIGAFYLPLAVMIVIYYRIYMVSSRIAEAEARSKPHDSNYRRAEGNIALTQIPVNKNTAEGGIINIEMSNNINIDPGSYDAINKGLMNRSQSWLNTNGNNDKSDLQLLPNDQILPKGSAGGGGDGGNVTIVSKKQSIKPRKFASLSNECKATKTLGIIMGAFTACWLPFFILALVKPLCSNSDGVPDESSCIPHWLNSLFQWLGYANSFLNPIIYARFNRDFRTPFKEILLLRCRGINLRLRTESYAEQYGIKAVVGVATKRRMNICNTVVGYQSHGQTVVNLTNVKDNGNGNRATLCDNHGRGV